VALLFSTIWPQFPFWLPGRSPLYIPTASVEVFFSTFRNRPTPTTREGANSGSSGHGKPGSASFQAITHTPPRPLPLSLGLVPLRRRPQLPNSRLVRWFSARGERRPPAAQHAARERTTAGGWRLSTRAGLRPRVGQRVPKVREGEAREHSLTRRPARRSGSTSPRTYARPAWQGVGVPTLSSLPDDGGPQRSSCRARGSLATDGAPTTAQAVAQRGRPPRLASARSHPNPHTADQRSCQFKTPVQELLTQHTSARQRLTPPNNALTLQRILNNLGVLV